MWWNLPEIFEAIRDCFTNIFNFIFELIERSKQIMFIKREDYEALQEQIAELKAELKDVKGQYLDIWTQHCRNFLDDYEYALLLPKNDYKLKVWNQGRFEKGVKAVILGQEGPGTVPSLTIQK